MSNNSILVDDDSGDSVFDRMDFLPNSILLSAKNNEKLTYKDFFESYYDSDYIENEELIAHFYDKTLLLKDYGLLSANAAFIELGAEGRKLFEYLRDDPSVSENQPYEYFIAKRIKRAEDTDLLVHYQIENAKWQKELNPLIKTANQSTITTNENIRNSNNNLISIFLITAFIASLSFGVSVVTLYRDSRIDKLTKKIEEQESLLKSKDKVIEQLSGKAGH